MSESVPAIIQVPERTAWHRDLAVVLLLLLLAGGVRWWLVAHTEVAARDSIGFVRMALGYEKLPWMDVTAANHQHPLYPMSVMVASWPVRAWQGDDPTPENMRLSAQIASSAAGWLLVIPMYFLGTRLFSRSVGFWTALLFQVLPVSGQVLSDGISEALYLLLTAAALLQAARALDRGKPLAYGLCGIFSGLAYLTRPEGGLVVLAVLAALLILQFRKEWRLAWPALAARAACLFAGVALAGSPYVMATGRLTNKPAAHHIVAQAGDATPRSGPVWALMLPTDGPWPLRFWNGLKGVATELIKAFHYIAWLPALVGMWWYRRRNWAVPGMLAMVVLCALHGLVLWRLAVVVGYLSDRHTLVLVMCGLFAAVAALHEAPLRLAALLKQGYKAVLAPGSWPMFQRASLASLVLLLGLAGLAMPRTFQRMHSNRAAHHAAGRWLAERFRPGDRVDDDHAWAHYYAGCVFREGQLEPNPLPASAQRYIVLGRRVETEGHLSAIPRPVSEEKLRADGGQVVFHWPADREVARAELVVFALPRSRE